MGHHASGTPELPRRVGARVLARAVSAVALLLASLVTSGCGGADDAGSGGTKVIRWTTDRDPVGQIDRLVAACNDQAAGKWEIHQVTMPPSVDAKREQLTRRLAAEDPSLDLLSIDVVWTAEFSEAGWIKDISKRMEPRAAEYLPAALETVRYDGSIWAIPMSTNVAMLFYRTDLVERPPGTWEELVEMAKAGQARDPEMRGLLFQAAQYEGLTVDAIEFMAASGGAVLDEQGEKATLDSGDGAAHGLAFMRMLVEEGISPKMVVTHKEEESRLAFQNGDAMFMRNWPYVWSLANDKSSSVAGKFDVAPLPGFEGRGRAGVLGGANVAMSAYTRHPEESWEAMQCLSGEQAQRSAGLERGELPTLERLYEDAEMLAAMPYLKTARTSLDTAVPRPVTPYYNDVSRAIYSNANEVVSGQASTEDAIEAMQSSVQKAIDGEGEI